MQWTGFASFVFMHHRAYFLPISRLKPSLYWGQPSPRLPWDFSLCWTPARFKKSTGLPCLQTVGTGVVVSGESFHRRWRYQRRSHWARPHNSMICRTGLQKQVTNGNGGFHLMGTDGKSPHTQRTSSWDRSRNNVVFFSAVLKMFESFRMSD